MDVRSLLFIAIFQLFNTTMAEWNPYSSLHLVDIQAPWQKFTKIFHLEIPSGITPIDRYNNALHYEFCPNPDAPNKNCNYGNLDYGMPESMTEQFKKECPEPVVYNVLPELNELEQHVQCIHNQMHGHIYHFVYMLCQFNEKESRGEKIIYKMCYRDAEKQPILASAVIEKPSLLRDALLIDEQTYTNFAFDGTHWCDPYTQDIINVSANLYDQEGSNYTATFVLPPVLFPFAHQNRTIYHHMNLAPMESTLTKAWDSCLDKLVEKLSKHPSPIVVYAGLLDVLKNDQGDVQYLGEYEGKKEIPIPGIFWIMIVSESYRSGVAIIIHNIDYSTVEIQPIEFFNRDDCTVQVCRDANLGSILPTSQLPVYIVCCKPKAINDYFETRVRNAILQIL